MSLTRRELIELAIAAMASGAAGRRAFDQAASRGGKHGCGTRHMPDAAMRKRMEQVLA